MGETAIPEGLARLIGGEWWRPAGLSSMFGAVKNYVSITRGGGGKTWLWRMSQGGR
jgi:hypothetical protein